jgi:hypothetical protein
VEERDPNNAPITPPGKNFCRVFAGNTLTKYELLFSLQRKNSYAAYLLCKIDSANMSGIRLVEKSTKKNSRAKYSSVFHSGKSFTGNHGTSLNYRLLRSNIPR